MAKFKKVITSETMMLIGFLFAVLAISMMFVPAIDGKIINSSVDIFFDRPGADIRVGVWPVFVGYMLITLGGIILLIMALPFVKPTLKLEKAILIITIILLTAGAVLCFITYNLVIIMNNFSSGLQNVYSPLAGPYLAGIFSLISAGCTVWALKLDW